MASQNIQEVLPYAVNFGIVLVILGAVLKKPARKFIYQRHERMKDAFESATIAHQKASLRAQAARQSIGALAGEEGALASREREFAEQEKQEILTKARAEAKRVAEDSERLAGAEQADASERVKEEFLRLVVAQTEDSLRRNLKRDDHQAILRRAQSSIEVGV